MEGFKIALNFRHTQNVTLATAPYEVDFASRGRTLDNQHGGNLPNRLDKLGPYGCDHGTYREGARALCSVKTVMRVDTVYRQCGDGLYEGNHTVY